MRRALSLRLILISFQLPSAFAVTCYILDRNAAPGWIPCNPDANGVNIHSACCSPGDVCLESGLCLSTTNQDPNGMFWVDACTDQTFKDKACPSYCIDSDNLPLTKKFFNLMQCANKSDTWCCDYGSTTTAGLSQGVGTVIRQLPPASLTGAASTTTAAQASSGTSVCPSVSTQHANTGYLAAIVVTSAAFAFTFVALLVSLYRLRRLRQSNEARAPQKYDEILVEAPCRGIEGRASLPQELES